MKGKTLVKKIRRPYISVPVQTESGEEKIDFPQITKGDWDSVKLACAEHRKQLIEAGVEQEKVFDLWAMLLEISSGIDESTLAGKNEKEREEAMRKHGMDMFKRIDHFLQVEIFWRSLLHDDPEITRDEVDEIISYGIADMAQYVQALTFFIYGAKPEDIVKTGETPLLRSDKSSPTPSEEEQ